MSRVSMSSRHLVVLWMLACAEPVAERAPAVVVEVAELMPGMQGARVDVEVVNSRHRLSGGWQPAEWDPAGFGFAWLNDTAGSIQLDAALPARSTVRMRLRAAGEGQTVALSGQPSVAVGDRWEVLEVEVPIPEDGVLELVPERSFRLDGDDRALSIAVDWIEVVPAGAGRIVERTVALDMGSGKARDEMGAGWGANEGSAEANWVWTVADEATATFSAAGTAVELDLRMRPFRWDGADDAVIGVALNGDEAQPVRLEDGWAVYRLRYDATEIRAGDNELVLTPSPIGSPEALGLGPDARQLGVAVDRIQVASLSRPVFESGGWSLRAGQSVQWVGPLAGEWMVSAEGSLEASCVSSGGERMELRIPNLLVGAACVRVELTAMVDDVRLLGIEAVQP